MVKKEVASVEAEKENQQEKAILEKIESHINDPKNIPNNLVKGAILQGKVVKIRKGEILVDVGAKAEGVVSGRELKSDHLNVSKLGEGDELLVYVVDPESVDGQLILSIRRTGQARRWLQLEESKSKNEIVEAEVIEVNSGGVIVSLGEGIRGFIPTSQLDPSRVFSSGQRFSGKDVSYNVQQKLSVLINQSIKSKISEIVREKNRIILSEKYVTQASDMELKQKTLSKIKLYDGLEGTISGITPYGIFVNAQGLEGLVHLSEISWDKVENIGNLYAIGDKVKVQVIGIDDGGKRIAYSIKRLQEDTWSKEISKLKVGDVVEGEVQRVVDYGAFVRIGKGLNGLIHISELSDGLVSDPRKIVQEDQKVKVKILSISPTERHLGLSLKRASSESGKKSTESKQVTEKPAKAKVEKVEKVKKVTPTKDKESSKTTKKEEKSAKKVKKEPAKEIAKVKKTKKA